VLPNYMQAFGAYVNDAFLARGQEASLVVSYHDVGVGETFANVKSDCYGLVGQLGYSVENMLDDVRARYAGTLRTYYVNSPLHTWTTSGHIYPDDLLYVRQKDPAGDTVPLRDWIGAIVGARGSVVDGGPPAPEVGPQ
jgi:hypothetical protein